MLTAKGRELVLASGVLGPKPDKRADLFAVNFIRQSDDGNGGDGGVGLQDLLDLARIDVFAAPDDHFLHPAFDR